MDTFMNKIERLTATAAMRPDPVPLDANGVMARIRGLEVEDDVFVLPLGFFAGGVAAAAAVALALSLVAATDWSQMNSPAVAMSSIVDVMDILL